MALCSAVLRSRASVAASGRRLFSLAAPGQPPYRVLFFGTDDISLATLRALHANSQEQDDAKLVESIEVVSPSDRKVGRGGARNEPVPVAKFAHRHGLPVVHTPPQLKSLKKWDFPVTGSFDVGVVVSFGYFLHPHMLANLHHGAINMHPSLLPKYRGAAPIHHALLNGDAKTGISVIEIDPRAFDVGRVLLQQEYVIPDGVQLQQLTAELASMGAECVIETLRDLTARKRDAVVQDDALSTKAPKISAADGALTLTESADDVFHKWQALGDSVGVRVDFRGKSVKLIDVRRPSADDLAFVEQQTHLLNTLTIGGFFLDKARQAFWLRCAGDSWLLVSKLQQADRKVGFALDFANGFRLKAGQPDRFEPADSSSTTSAAPAA